MKEDIRIIRTQSQKEVRNPFYADSRIEHSYGYKSAERDGRIEKRKKERRKKQKIVVGVMMVFVLFLFGFLYTVFRFRAQVTLDLSKYKKGGEVEYTAYREPTGTMIPFYLTTETIDINKSITASGTKQVSRVAEGYVTFYNKLGTSQKFKAKTRLSDKEGNLYFTENKEFVLPAGTEDKPGEFKIKVSSQKPGKEFNKSSGEQLQIIGWKGTLKYEKQFAKVERIEGGEVGIVPDIDENELASEKEKARTNLLNALTERAHANQDDTLLVYPVPESLAVNAIDTTVSPTNSTEMILKESGSITVIKIKKDDLAGYIAGAEGLVLKPNEFDIKFVIKNEKEISITPTETLPVDLYSMPSIPFKILGDPQIGYDFNLKKFVDSIKGHTVTEADTTMRNAFDFKYINISVRPFWMNYLPKRADYIDIIVK